MADPLIIQTLKSRKMRGAFPPMYASNADMF
jgi:hypothetical protein